MANFPIDSWKRRYSALRHKFNLYESVEKPTHHARRAPLQGAAIWQI